MTDLDARFWKFVNQSGPVTQVELGPCWLWTGGITGNRRPAFWLAGRTQSSTRLVLGLDPGVSGEACHHCDQPLCVRPSHLYIGSAKTNAADRETRKRHAHHPTSPKLTMAQARELRRKYEDTPRQRGPKKTPTLRQIGLEYGLSPAQVCLLLQGKTYREEVVPHED